MTELLQLEPRVVGQETIEPPADFTAEGSWMNRHDRARCPQTVHGHTITC